MKELILQLAIQQLRELNFVLNNVLCIPESVFREHGTAGLGLMLRDHAVRNGQVDDYALPNVEARFDALCNAAPNTPRDAIQLFSQAYAGITTFFDDRFTYPGDVEAIKMLMVVSLGLGGAMGVISATREVENGAQKEARTLLGILGANAAHKENRSCKADAFAWLDANFSTCKSMDAAAEAMAGKIVPQKFRTVRDWVTEWKKLRSASTP